MEKARLGEIAELITKGTTPTSIGYKFEEKGISFVKIEAISTTGRFLENKFSYISEECNNNLKRSQLCENDILFSIAGAIGRVAIVEKEILPANTNQALAIIRINDKYNKRFLKYLLSSNYIKKQYNKKKQGVAQVNLSLKDIAEFEIPVMDLKSQNKIVNKLDKVQELIDLKNKQKEELEEFIMSKFVELFGEIISNSKNWKLHKWMEVLEIRNGRNQKEVEDVNGKYPIYGSGGIMSYANDYICKEDTVIVGRKGNINNPILVRTKFWNVDTAFGLEPNKQKIVVEYLYYFCKFYNFEKHNRAVTIPSLTKSDLLNIDIPVPDFELQNQFAKIVQEIDEQKKKVENNLQGIKKLQESLMNLYFE